jgi:hypothetical protein
MGPPNARIDFPGRLSAGPANPKKKPLGEGRAAMKNFATLNESALALRVVSSSAGFEQQRTRAESRSVANDGVDGPWRHHQRQTGGADSQPGKGSSMANISTIGFDLAKNVFQIHGIDAAGRVLRRQLRRGQMEKFFASLPPTVVGMEACSGAHHWTHVLKAWS